MLWGQLLHCSQCKPSACFLNAKRLLCLAAPLKICFADLYLCLIYRFLYSDEVQIGPETVMTTLYTAKKYAVPALEAHCVDFLTKHLRADNAFMLLTQVGKFKFSFDLLGEFLIGGNLLILLNCVLLWDFKYSLRYKHKENLDKSTYFNLCLY